MSGSWAVPFLCGFCDGRDRKDFVGPPVSVPNGAGSQKTCRRDSISYGAAGGKARVVWIITESNGFK